MLKKRKEKINGKDYFMYPNEVKERVESLRNLGMHIEGLFIQAAAVEKELEDLIDLFDKLAEKTLKRNRIKFHSAEYRRSQFGGGMTLGAKHKYLKIYLSDTNRTHARVNVLLTDFIRLRNKAIHHLYDHDLSILEREIEGQRWAIFELIVLLRRLQGQTDRRLEVKKKPN